MLSVFYTCKSSVWGHNAFNLFKIWQWCVITYIIVDIINYRFKPLCVTSFRLSKIIYRFQWNVTNTELELTFTLLFQISGTFGSGQPYFSQRMIETINLLLCAYHYNTLSKFSSQYHFTHPYGATNIIIPLNEQLDNCTSSLKYYHLLAYFVDNPYLEASTDGNENLSHQIFRHICD